MKIEDQCVSLEYAKKLKEIGAKQNSIFYWEKSIYKFIFKKNGEKEIEEYKTSLCMTPAFDLSRSIDYWSAFTVSELGEMLPDHSGTIKVDGMWEGIIYKGNILNGCKPVLSKNESDARAQMLIYLIENEIVKS